MRNNENGRSMVEMLGVLAIIGVLSAGGLAGYSKAMFKHKLNSTMEQITMLVTNIRTAYGSQGNYSTLSVGGARKLGAIPAIMVSGNSLTNPFKGAVSIGPSKARSTDTADGTAFTVEYDGLPKEACIALATADFGSGAGSGFIGVVVGETVPGTTQHAALQQGQTEPTPLNLDVYIGQGNGRSEGGSGANAYAAQDASRGEGEAYSMAAAISACTEQSKVSWKFY